MGIKEMFVKVYNQVYGLDKIKEQKNALNDLGSASTNTAASTDRLTQATEKQKNARDNDYRSSQKQLMGNLGVMFAGMALQRSMQNLTSTAKEWTGIGELMSDTMGIVMLPATLELLNDGILPLSEALIGLSEETQMAIGVSALSFEAIGAAAGFLGQAGLAGGALESLFPNQISKGKGAGVMIKGVVGLSLSVAGVTMFLSGVSEQDLMSELSGAIALGFGAAFIASTVGATAAGAAFIGLISAAAAVSVALTVNWFVKKSNKRQALKAAGLSDEQIDAEISRDVTLETQTPLPSLISSATGIDIERISPAFSTGLDIFSKSSGLGGLISGLFGRSSSESSQTQIVQNNTYSGFGMNEVDSLIQQNNQNLTSEIRRITN